MLDLDSGAGADVLISARRVDPTGKAYGLDMTDEMLDLAHGPAASRAHSPVANSRRPLGEAGFVDIEITETHRVHAHAGSAIVRARKPADA